MISYFLDNNLGFKKNQRFQNKTIGLCFSSKDRFYTSWLGMWLRKNNALVFVTILLTISTLPLGTNYQSFPNRSHSPASDDLASIMNVLEPLPNPNLSVEPSVIINGSSSDFTFSYMTFENQSDNYLNMSWIHSYSSSLVFSSDSPDDDRPRCNDFIYMYQDFEWEYDSQALAGAIQMEYQAQVTGDFLSDGPHVDAFVWIIDESEYWTSLYRIRFDVAPDSGIQHLEEPLNDGLYHLKRNQIFHLAIGFTPQQPYLSSQSWQNLNGSFSLSIRSVSLGLLGGTSDTLDEPTYFMPSFDGRDSTCRSMDISSDDNIFTVGSIGDYNYSNFDLEFLLTKWTPSGKLLWYREQHYDNDSTGLRVFISDDNLIFTIGIKYPSREIIVGKWDSSGNKMWEKSLQIEGIYLEDSVRDTAGNFYFTGYVQNEGNDDARILKFDKDLNSIWNRTLPIDRIQDLVIGTDDSIYVSTWWDQIIHLSPTNELLQNITMNISIVSSVITYDDKSTEPALYAVGYSSPQCLKILKFDENLNLLWQTQFNYSWHEILFSKLYFAGISVAPNGSLFIYGTLSGVSPICNLLLEYSPDGTLLHYLAQRYETQMPTFMVCSDRNHNMIFSSRGTLYISGAMYDDPHRNLTLLIIGDYVESNVDIIMIASLVIGTSIVIIAIVVILCRRHRM